MSLSIDENNEILLNRIKVKYLSTKIDGYGNEHVLYEIATDDFYDIVATVPKDFKVPWFKGKKKPILKVKSRWVKDNDKTTIEGMVKIRMKEYDFEGSKGYYVNMVSDM